MITAVRTANIHDGKAPEAFAWAVKVAQYLNSKWPETRFAVVRNIGGPIFQLHWVSNYDSLAVFEAAMKTVEADSGYQAMLQEGRQQQLFIASSIVDHLYETVS